MLGAELSHLGDELQYYPNLCGAAELLTNIEPEKLFQLGLKVLLDGMDCRLAELPVRRRPS